MLRPLSALLITLGCGLAAAQQPTQVSFLWHMHQPVYYPYENPVQVDNAGRFSYSVVDVHNQRLGPYTAWPANAIAAGSGLSHLGAQVSFSGSLIENLNSLAAAGVNGGQWVNWQNGYAGAIGMSTSLGNPRLDLVAFGYHHPLMPLLDEDDIRMQIRLHKAMLQQTWPGTAYSRGMFPAETAFSTRMIPALVAEGIEWIIVDNIHFDRACVGYPHTPASNLFPPNPADQINPNPTDSGGAWLSLQNLWAPSQVSAPFGYRPHYAEYVDPDTGDVSRIVVVPAARYEGNEDGRGGYGAFLYDQVMDAYLPYNTDPDHPLLVLLHHDGDNFGGGSEAYYNSNFQAMVNWVSGDPDYDVTTIQDYLDRFPVDPDDVIHVEDGSWAGADNGDAEFKKWLADPDGTGWSPDRNSWAVLTAAKNHVITAESLAPVVNVNNVINGTGSNTAKAWRFLLVAQASDYWYWDGTEIWDSNVTRGCNQAVAFAAPVISGQADAVGPTIFTPQREPYNPGGFEWGATPEPSDFEVWTYAYDVSGLGHVTLHWRVDADGSNPLDSSDNETYAGGSEVGPWNAVAMTSSDVPPPPGILAPTHRALRYGAMITGQQDVLIDYFVESQDLAGNVRRSPIQHVYVGQAAITPGGDAVTLDPNVPVAGQNVTIGYDPTGGPLAAAGTVYLHYGFDNWGSVVSPDPAMSYNATSERWELTVPVAATATQLDLVFNDGAGTWDNNGGADWHFTVDGGTTPGWQMDGQLDAGATLVASDNGRNLWIDFDGTTLYVATEDAGEGQDHFIYVASPPGSLQPANWAKAGSIAAWEAYLADENDNGFNDWFDASGTRQSATGANGGVLEGTLDLAGEFGSVPATIHLAVGVYATADGGALQSGMQLPASVDGNGNLNASEYLAIDLGTFGGGCVEDFNGDGTVDLSDLATLLGNFGSTSATAADGDTDADGDVDLSDLAAVLSAFGTSCP